MYVCVVCAVCLCVCMYTVCIWCICVLCVFIVYVVVYVCGLWCVFVCVVRICVLCVHVLYASEYMEVLCYSMKVEASRCLPLLLPLCLISLGVTGFLALLIFTIWAKLTAQLALSILPSLPSTAEVSGMFSHT